MNRSEERSYCLGSPRRTNLGAETGWNRNSWGYRLGGSCSTWSRRRKGIGKATVSPSPPQASSRRRRQSSWVAEATAETAEGRLVVFGRRKLNGTPLLGWLRWKWKQKQKNQKKNESKEEEEIRRKHR